MDREPGPLQFMGSQRVRPDWEMNSFTFFSLEVKHLTHGRLGSSVCMTIWAAQLRAPLMPPTHHPSGELPSTPLASLPLTLVISSTWNVPSRNLGLSTLKGPHSFHDSKQQWHTLSTPKYLAPELCLCLLYVRMLSSQPKCKTSKCRLGGWLQYLRHLA